MCSETRLVLLQTLPTTTARVQMATRIVEVTTIPNDAFDTHTLPGGIARSTLVNGLA